MTYRKNVRQLALTVIISAALMGLAGCGKDNSEEVPGLTVPVEDAIEESADKLEQETGLTIEKAKSLEDVSMRDAEAYLDALRQEDAELLSGHMVPAENEYTVDDMAKVLEGFRLYFDDLQELQLKYLSNEQDEEYYIERFAIDGTKDGQGRDIPFVVKYAKSQGMEAIQDDARRVPLYDSPLIGIYPYAEREPGRYLQAMIQHDTESIALHLGLYDDNKETSVAVEKTLQRYRNSLDLNSVRIESKGYDSQKMLFSFELSDNNGKVHELQVNGDGLRIVDEWAAVSEAE